MVIHFYSCHSVSDNVAAQNMPSYGPMRTGNAMKCSNRVCLSHQGQERSPLLPFFIIKYRFV